MSNEIVADAGGADDDNFQEAVERLQQRTSTNDTKLFLLENVEKLHCFEGNLA